MIIALIILAIFLILVFVLGFMMATYSMGIKPQTLEEARKWQEGHYDLSWYDPLPKQDYTVSGGDGYALHVQFLKNPVPSDRYILISHGYTDNRFGAMKYAKMYLDLGFNVIAYDLRGHGENEPTFCTYSARESMDLNALIQDSRGRYPDAKVFGLHGESLGAATSIAVLKYKPDVDFVVADCGFSEIASVLAGGLKAMHVPGLFVNVASLCAKMKFGYSYQDMRPIDSLKDNTVPILFIHGEKDDFILPAHSEAMRNATQGYSELHLIPGAGHAASILTAPEQYRQYVEAFLRQVIK
ncbi:MAG: alpha/beta fold hydrolase [Clostridia bacterium]|nr:alpha/beta fold hydrolase [Clostridia bacterium]